jgi:hypothetical protein
MTARERKLHLDSFARGEVTVLCACDLLNEGWDCPSVEVLFMARPTLSKVIYLQQLGRGTRKAPGKECLVVFDFVDNATRYNQSLSLHRILGRRGYRPGSLVLSPAADLQSEEDALSKGVIPTQVLPLELWVRDFQEIDVFDWQETISGMLSSADVEVELATTEGRVRAAVQRGLITPDHTLELGERTYYYFRRDRVEELRQELGLPRVDDESIRGLFFQFLSRMDMSSSYKPVMLVAILDHIDEQGTARIDHVAGSFHAFYLKRIKNGLPAERRPARMAEADRLSIDDVRTIMLSMPFSKFEQRKYLSYDQRDVAYLRFNHALWRQLSADDMASIRQICNDSIVSYFERTGS